MKKINSVRVICTVTHSAQYLERGQSKVPVYTVKVQRLSGVWDTLYVYSTTPMKVNSIYLVEGTIAPQTSLVAGLITPFIIIFAHSVKPSEDGFLNSVEIICKLQKPAVLRKTSRDNKVALLKVSQKDNSEKTPWLSVVCWGALAKQVSTYSIGTELLVQGILQSKSFGDTDSENQRTVMELAAQTITNLDALKD